MPVIKNGAVKSSPRKIFLVLLATLLFAFALWAQKPKDQPAPFKIPPEEAAKVNPVKPTPESLAKGKKLYNIDCAMCHGKDGDGKGDMASDIKNVTDFTQPNALKNRSDGELSYIVRHGKGEMPPEGDRAKDEDIWNLVNYIRSLAKQ
jgi:mono/diheme cytochrome c family protein